MMNFHFGLDLKLLTFSISKCISNHIENICQVNDILLPGKTNFERSRMEILFLTVKILQVCKFENSYFYIIFDASKNQ